MTPWTRRLIGNRGYQDTEPSQQQLRETMQYNLANRATQPLDDTPADAATLGWLPSDALADAVTQAQLPSEAGHWDHVIAYSMIFVVGFALGALVMS